MGNLPTHIYGYNNDHDVIVYMVVEDMQSECGQPRHHFQKSPFWSLYTETQTIGITVANVMRFKTKAHQCKRGLSPQTKVLFVGWFSRSMWHTAIRDASSRRYGFGMT